MCNRKDENILKSLKPELINHIFPSKIEHFKVPGKSIQFKLIL